MASAPTSYGNATPKPLGYAFDWFFVSLWVLLSYFSSAESVVLQGPEQNIPLFVKFLSYRQLQALLSP